MLMLNTLKCMKLTCQKSKNLSFAARTIQMMRNFFSDVQGDKIDEVFIGSCMTNIGHFRAAGQLLEKVPSGSLTTRLWLAPPTRMDEHQLMEEGFYNTYGRAGARTEMPGCSLCMGNQARVAPNTTVVSTSTRNFPNRLGQGSNVYSIC